MSKKASIATYIALGVVIALLLGALIFVSVSNSDTIMALGNLNDTLEGDNATLKSRLDSLESQKQMLEGELSALEAKLSDAGKYYEDEIEALKAEIAEKQGAIAELEADIAKYQTVFTIDVRSQAKLINDIVDYIETKFPYVRVPNPEWSEDLLADEEAADSKQGNKAEDEEEIPQYLWVKVDTLIDEEIAARAALGDAAEPLFTEDELLSSGLDANALTRVILREKVLAREDVVKPNVSVYYEDILTGYSFDYAASLKYDCASVVKAPYILSVLKAVAADEEAYLAALKLEGKQPEMIDTDEDGIPDKTVIEYSDPIYNLSDVVIYDSKTMIKEGSGKIKDMPDGTELTYFDFIKYALEYSDNIAYQQLKNRFGYERYYALGREVKANSIVWAPAVMTAADAGKLFKAIYEFTEENEVYGQILIDSMSKANHTVIIPSAVSPTKALHKYGWDKDSYHDAAVVLNGDKPYVIAVFSDLDIGGNEVNIYLREIVKMINKLHNGFYKK